MNADMGALRFDAFTLDVAGRVLLQGEEQLSLRPQSFDVLVYLAKRSGQLVTSKELIETFWDPKRASDNSLARCITDIRDALGDTDHRIVRTVPRRGYVLAAKVSEAAPAPATTPPAHARVPDGRSGPAAAPQAGWQAPLIAACLLVAVLAGSGWLVWSFARPGPSGILPMMATPSIAVLPVKPLGDETDNGVAALADEIIAGVWRGPRGFKPDIRPTTALKDALADPKAIGRKLGVRYIVRSSVRREGDLIHINVHLIEGELARAVWVGAFDYRLSETGAQSRTAARIGRTLAAELVRAEAQRPLPRNPEAGHFTILGRWLMNNERDAKANGEAIALFEKAINIDPTNFEALAHYARATADHILNGWAPKKERAERIAKAEAAIKLAIKLEPDSAGAHLTHGGVLRARGDHEQAIAAFKLALLHNPNFANAHAELGRTMIDVDQSKEAIDQIKKAIALSPTDFAIYNWYYFAGLAALHLSDHEGALDWLRKSHQANRGNDNTLRLMAVALADAGREEEARKKIGEFLKARPGATLDDLRRPNWNSHPEVAARRERIRATLQRLGVPEERAQAGGAPELTMMAVPSIAVMPFKSAGSEDAALADEIATQLARVPRGFKIAIRSTAAYKDKAADLRTIGHDLDARYIVLGGLRREGEAVRVNVQLIEAETSRQLWAGPFDYAPGEAGARNRTAAQIARLVTDRLLATESKRPLPVEPQADHYAVMGRAMWAGERDAKVTLEAMALFKKGLDLNPDSVPALQGYARAKISAVLSDWAPKDQRSLWLDEAEAAIDRVVAQQRRSYGAYRLRGSLYRARGDLEQAVKALEHALDLNSDYAEAHAELGRVKIELGLAHEAAAHIEKALTLSPTDSAALFGWCLWAGEAAIHVGDYQAAVDWLARARQANRADKSPALWLAVAYAGLGRDDKARAEMTEYLHSMPGFTLAGWNRSHRRDNPVVAAQRERIAKMLNELGVPEREMRTGATR